MNSLMRIVVGLLAGLFGLAFLAAILAALGLYMAFATVRWLLTGRKPQVVMVWNQFGTLRQNFRQGGFRARTSYGFDASKSPHATSNDDHVVDVEVREVVEDAPRLPPSKPL